MDTLYTRHNSHYDVNIICVPEYFCHPVFYSTFYEPRRRAVFQGSLYSSAILGGLGAISLLYFSRRVNQSYIESLRAFENLHTIVDYRGPIRMKWFGLSFSLKNGLSFSLRFPTERGVLSVARF